MSLVVRAPRKTIIVALLVAILVPPFAPSRDVLPGPLSSIVPQFFPMPQAAAAAEVLTQPGFVSAAVMPNGEVGLLFANGNNGVNTAAEIRFKRYFTEHGMDASQQLSTAGPFYPQLATFQDKVIAAYVDSRSPNDGKLTFRVSTDNGATGEAEFTPFSSESFNRVNLAPMLITSRDGARLPQLIGPGVRTRQARNTRWKWASAHLVVASRSEPHIGRRSFHSVGEVRVLTCGY